MNPNCWALRVAEVLQGEWGGSPVAPLWLAGCPGSAVWPSVWRLTGRHSLSHSSECCRGPSKPEWSMELSLTLWSITGPTTRQSTQNNILKGSFFFFNVVRWSIWRWRLEERSLAMPDHCFDWMFLFVCLFVCFFVEIEFLSAAIYLEMQQQQN